ncbi:MAG: type II toxin-antitoxin system RelE/ParE family toxin [Oscillospiraceae bacterium]
MEIIKNKMFDNIYEVVCFQEEFENITKEKSPLTPPFLKYQKWLIRSLTMLEEFQERAINLKGFEQLKNVNPNLYSIRYPKSELNPRVLYVYLENKHILLLAVFKEKNKQDYTKNIKVAHKRLTSVIGETKVLITGE